MFFTAVNQQPTVTEDELSEDSTGRQSKVNNLWNGLSLRVHLEGLMHRRTAGESSQG